MLGIGMQEMLVIGLAALLIFGPGKLPEVMGQAGKLFKDFRNMTSELTGEFEKTVAEAKQMGNQITGDLGPMQSQVNSITKSVQRDLGTGSKSKSTPARKTSSSSKAVSTAKKATTASKTTSSSASGKGKSTTSTTRSSGANAAKTGGSSSTATAKKVASAPVATKDEPDIDFSMFEVTAPERTRRARTATPSMITDPTPRGLFSPEEAELPGDVAGSASANEDPIARARQRRRNAGYAKRSA